MLNLKFQLLNKLIQTFEKQGLEVAIDKDTICIGRPQWDNYSRQFLYALSAAPYVKQGKKSFYIFVVEQYDPSGKIKKYSINLCNRSRNLIKAYHYDIKRGSHIHKIAGSKKGRKHIKFSKKLDDIVSDILDEMRIY